MSGRDGSWPEDEAPPTEEELEQARAFGQSLDGSEAPRPEQRDLRAAAEMLRASVREERLPKERKVALVEQAVAERRAATPARRRFGLKLGGGIALAATLLVALNVGLMMSKRAEAPMPAATAPLREAPVRAPSSLSRPSDALLGQPIRDRAGAARRIDLVFADRLSHLRARLLAGEERE
ncbi:MAG: hypothetical protein IT371_10345 [Deltaproteobacteria bacterium]|nr:hypothetical protein [Deltaproteobacteria bacterium]